MRVAQHTAVLVLTSDDDPQLIAGMLHQGARGYLVHGEFDPPSLLACGTRGGRRRGLALPGRGVGCGILGPRPGRPGTGAVDVVERRRRARHGSV